MIGFKVLLNAFLISLNKSQNNGGVVYFLAFRMLNNSSITSSSLSNFSKYSAVKCGRCKTSFLKIALTWTDFIFFGKLAAYFKEKVVFNLEKKKKTNTPFT